MPFSIPEINFNVVGPEIAVFTTALVVLLIALKENWKPCIPHITIIGLLAAYFFAVRLWGTDTSTFSGMLVADKFSVICNLIFIAGTFLIVLLSNDYIKRTDREGEYYFLILSSVLGMMLMAGSRNLIMIFLGVETMSIPLYVLAGYNKYNERSLEAALKYLLLGAFASAFLLFGISFIYGAVGSIDFTDIASYIRENEFDLGKIFYIGIGLLTIGFGFKIALVPFHMWVPDVYEGAPTPITAFMAAAVKTAGFSVIIRFFIFCAGTIQVDWFIVFWILSVLTMTIGNVIALVQNNIKRLLAYSSIAHAGYILVALTPGGNGAAPALYYLIVYMLMTIGSFGIVVYLTKDNEELLEINGYSGLGYKKPLLSAVMAVFMFSLAGIPPTAGFFGKLYIFRTAMDAGLTWLTILAVLNAVLAVYYYLRVIVMMYMKEPETDFSVYGSKPVVSIALFITTLGIILLGIYPGVILNFLSRFVGILG